jgi:cytochrome c553
MSLMAKPLSDEDINQLAAYYSGIAISTKKP